MPSFDIVSRVDLMEVQNAINQANRELQNRFDFKGANAEIQLEKDQIKLSANDKPRINALADLVIGKLAKRGVSLKNLDRPDADISPLGHARQVINIKQGIDGKVAKDVTAFIRETKLKVTASIQGDEVRVTGKNRDDLQQAIAAVREKDFPVELAFVNFRD